MEGNRCNADAIAFQFDAEIGTDVLEKEVPILGSGDHQWIGTDTAVIVIKMLMLRYDDCQRTLATTCIVLCIGINGVIKSGLNRWSRSGWIISHLIKTSGSIAINSIESKFPVKRLAEENADSVIAIPKETVRLIRICSGRCIGSSLFHHRPKMACGLGRLQFLFDIAGSQGCHGEQPQQEMFDIHDNRIHYSRTAFLKASIASSVK